MNDYDDSEDYSSANSFRARSNTWPLKRQDLAVPNSVCIDETLPEIELEEDDLFTTNENWATGLVDDHDIMSWDPILNAQSHHHQATATNNQQSHHQQQQQQATTIHHHHHQQQLQSQQQAHPSRQQPTIHPQQQQPPQHHHQQHETLIGGSTIIVAGQVQHQQAPQQLPPQQHQQQQPPPPPPQQHHQTLNNTHCLDSDDPNDYHIQQLHHLRLDGNQAAGEHQAHYISPLSSSICIQGSNAALSTESYNISSDHQQHHLQPLTSARYDLDHQNDLDLKTHDNELQQHHHQIHHLTPSSLDHHSVGSSHMLSSSLSTSGICLSGDLEDLDYKGVDPSTILRNPQFDEQTTEQQQQQTQQHQLQQTNESGGGVGLDKLSSSVASSKTKLNTPRRNAWGNMSYADLISQAINSTNDKRLTLSQIYDWMVQHVPYFKDKGDSNSSAGWKNSVRHNLSLHNRFKRLQNEGTGKSSWWTINPEANIGKCARRRATSMEASKYEKKRGRAKKRAEAVRQGLISYPSLTNSSLNGSSGALDQLQPQSSSSQFGPQQQTQKQQQQQQIDGLGSDNLHNNRQPNTGLYVATPQEAQYEGKDNKLQLQQQQQAQAQPPPNVRSPTPPPPPLQAPQLQPKQQEQPQQQAPNQAQHHQQQPQQQVHHQLQKMELHDPDSYYIQQHNLQHHDQNHHHHQGQILNSSDHMDLFGRHAIYMSEPCNDCNCTELINCGTNAMSFT